MIFAGGIVLLLLGIFHATFWLNPNWEIELSKMHPEMYALAQMLNIGGVTLMIGLGVVLIGFCNTVAATCLGRGLLLVIALFLLINIVSRSLLPTDGNLLINGVLFLCSLLYIAPALMKEK